MRTRLAIDPARSAALFVDLQEEHRKDCRYLVEGFDDLVLRVKRLQAAARAAGMPVFHSAYVVDPGNGGASPFHPMLEDGRSAFSDVGDPLSAVCAEVGPAADEVLLIKTTASSLAEGELPAMLKARGVEWLLIAGVWTEACIAATVKDAIGHGFRVLLVKDACGSGTAAMHQTAILNIANRLYGGAITDTDGACRLINGETVEAWRVQGSVPLRFTYDNAASLYAEL